MAADAVLAMTALHDQTIVGILGRFRSGELKPSVYLDGLLSRIDDLDGGLHAFVTLDRERARAAASSADRAYADARPRPLEGIPVGVKDMIDVEGLPTTCHSRLRLDHIAAKDAAVVASLRRDGAMILGKTATHEFAIGGPAFDLPFPPARNPWDRSRHPGGSSSGSAVGVAAGFFPAGLGTDTGGSVRHPASACGLVGLKPSYDAISRAGVFPLAFSLDHVGLITRSVGDAALLCDRMSFGRTGASPAIGQAINGLRVGYVSHFHEEDIPAVDELAAALEDGATRLQDAGALISKVRLPNLRSFAACNRTILQAEAFAVHGQMLRERPESYCTLSRRGLLPGAFLSAEDLVQAQRRRRQLIDAVDLVFRDVDVLLTASSMDFPCRIDDVAEIERSYSRQARTPFNVTGHPAITIPGLPAPNGLPTSLQIAGRAHDERTVCRVASAVERAFSPPPLAPI